MLLPTNHAIIETRMPFQICDSFHYAFKDLNYLIISAQKFRMLTVFLILSLNEKLCSSTDFPLFCLLVCVLAFEPNRAYKLNTTRLKLSIFSCMWQVPLHYTLQSLYYKSCVSKAKHLVSYSNYVLDLGTVVTVSMRSITSWTRKQYTHDKSY